MIDRLRAVATSLLGCLAVWLCILATPAHSADKLLFWKATAPSGGVAYLLGSVHFGQPEMYPLRPAVTEAFAEADALVVEVDVLALSPGTIALLFAKKGMYLDGQTLQDELRPETWAALQQAVQRQNMAMTLFDRQKPWSVAMTLTALAMKDAGYSEQWGIDQYFLKQAREEKKIIELETLAGQIAIFDNFTPAEQDVLLQQTLKEIDKGPARINNIIKTWQTGAAEELDRLLNEHFKSTPQLKNAYRVFISERNSAMTQKLVELLTEDQTLFVVVGAGHMVGADGIVELLRKRDYRIERQ